MRRFEVLPGMIKAAELQRVADSVVSFHTDQQITDAQRHEARAKVISRFVAGVAALRAQHPQGAKLADRIIASIEAGLKPDAAAKVEDELALD
jgi:hypothetical protein